jgi:hypothetical protein
MEIVSYSGASGDQELRLRQLITLGGEQSIIAMLERFAGHVENFLDVEIQHGWSAAAVHRLIGAAAMLGFSRLEAALRVMEEPRVTTADARRAASAGRAAVRFARTWTP